MVQSLYGVDEAQDVVWVFLEHLGQRSGELAGVSLELLAQGRELADQLGWPLAGLLLGDQVATLAEMAIAHGADRVWLIEHPDLATFLVEPATEAAHQAIVAERPSILLFGATPNGRDLAGRLAVRLRTGLNADCTDLRVDVERGVLISEVSGFGGGVLALIEIARHRPQMATVRPGVFVAGEPDATRAGDVQRLDVTIPASARRTRVVEYVVGEGVDLTQAPVLIVGGRGVDGEFGMLRELADLLGGEVGATRPPVDEGHIERARQIGQTGVVCRPKVAIVCGVSGAFHFVVGIQEAETVIAINSDPDAPIFDFADYGIVGDVHDVVPRLIETLKSIP
ncbi:MAG: electron transfer flavoprotein subunit alpha/FixB family protein [Anaerolineales bacterium]